VSCLRIDQSSIGVGGRIILELILKKWDVGGMDWIDLVQNRERWQVV
jgi:hypothetical protein